MSRDISDSTLEQLAKIHIKDVKSKKRWRFISKVTILILIILAIISISSESSDSSKKHIALINVSGIIAEDADVNSPRIIESLKNAYANNMTKAVIIKINSPGGSPVESDNIYQYMRYLQQKHPEIPMYAVCNDVCASGGYYIAAGAKNIYANKMTITGSIGVIGSGFGFTDLMKNVGIERRTYTAGNNKDFLDPFTPAKPEQTKDFEKLLNQTHNVFIDAVKTSRGDRLKNTSTETTFSGLPFSGIEAKEIGLIDDFGSVQSLKRDKLHNLPIVDYTQPLDFFTSLSSKFSNSVYYNAMSQSSFSLR